MTRLGSPAWRAALAVPIALSLTIGSALGAGATPEESSATPSPVASETPAEEAAEPTEQATAPEPTPATTEGGDVQVETVPAEYVYWALPYTSYLYEIGTDGALERALSLAASRAFLAEHPEQVGDAYAVGAVTFVSSRLESGDHYGRVDASLLGGGVTTTVLLTSPQVALARERLGTAYGVTNLAHIPGTRYLHYATAADPDEAIALLPTGTRVKMTSAQYDAAGRPALEISIIEFYTVPWSSSYVWQVNSETGHRTRLTTSEWRARYAAPGAATARMIIAKVPWDDSRYVFVYMGESTRWVRWLHNEAMKAAIRAVDPAAWRALRTVSHMPGSSYFQWEYARIEKFVRTPDGDIHKLTSSEYSAAGSPRLHTRSGHVVRPAWSASLWWFRSPTSSDGAHRISTARYHELAEPTPRVWTQLPGDSFYRWQGVSATYWRLKGHVEILSSAEYARAGEPIRALKLRPRGGYGGSYGENATPGQNGIVPADDLCVIPFLTSHRIRCGTLPDLLAFNDAYYARFGSNLPIDSWRYSTFRSYADQVAVWNEIGPPIAARPGTSPHGYGLAVDFVERYGFGSVQNRWLAAYGPRYHWVRQPWHDEGGSWGEWWHFDYIG